MDINAVRILYRGEKEFRVAGGAAHRDWMQEKADMDTFQAVGQGDGRTFLYNKDFMEVSKLSGRMDMDGSMPNYMQDIWECRGGVLADIREEQGSYGYSEVVDATGYAYAKCYADIENMYANPSMKGGRTKEEEIALLDKAYEYITDFDTANARVRAQLEKFNGNLTQMQEKDIEAYKDCFYESKERYMNRYKGKKEPVSCQGYRFELPQLFEQLNRLRWGNTRQGGYF